MSSASRQRLALATLWVLPLLWSCNYLIARLAPGVISPHQLALGRWTLALSLMLPWAWADRLAIRAAWRHEWWQWLVLGALGMWISGAVLYLGGQGSTVTNIGLIYAAAPVGIALISRKLLHERATALQRAAMGLALVGVVFVVIHGEVDNLLAVRLNPGDGWVLTAMVSWIGYSVLMPHWRSRLAARVRLACITAGGVACLLPATLAEAALSPSLPAPGWAAAGLVVLAGVVPGFLSYQVYSWLLKELGATRCGLLLYLSPLYSTFSAWWLLGEVPHWYHAVGAALILPSIWLASRPVEPAADVEASRGFR